MSGHMFSHPRKIDDLNKQSWHNFWAIQSGHYGMDKIASQEHYKMFYDLKPTKPILETEANYEDIKCSGRFNGYEATRISAWNHLANADLYINHFLVYYEVNKMEDGWHDINLFFGDWFIRKCMWSTASNVKTTATSIKKFYQCMYESHFIKKEDYENLSITRIYG